MEFDEAKLRGIDAEQLQQERFGTSAHYKMVELHEARAKLWRDYAKNQHEQFPEGKPKVAPVKKPVRVGSNKSKYQFTDAQLRIAQAVLEKEMKNNE